MFTINYRGFYIHSYCDKPECIIISEKDGLIAQKKSLHAAKIAITKFLKSTMGAK